MYDGGKIIAGLIIGLGLLSFPVFYNAGKAAKSPERILTVKAKEAKECVEPKAFMASRVSAETPERFWEGPFVIPVEGRPGSPFGLRRWINGEPRSAHSGLDIKAPEGKPVQAANRGKVVLVGDFFFGGNSVFVDHGQGVYTMYVVLKVMRV